MSIWRTLDNYLVRNELLYDYGIINLYPSEASATIKNEYDEDIIIGGCNRKSWLRFKIAEQTRTRLINPGDTVEIEEMSIKLADKSPKSEWTFLAGDYFEDMILDVARKSGIFLTTQKRILIPIQDTPYNVSGKIDGILREKNTNKLVGVEIKSINGYHAEKEIIKNRKPKWSHLIQTSLYAWAYKDQIDYFSLMYMMRDKLARTEFKITVHETSKKDFGIRVDGEKTPLKISKIMYRFKLLAQHLESKTLPPRDFDLIYDDSKMNLLSSRGELTKTINDQWTKHWDRKANGGRQVKRPDVGDFLCAYCPFQNFCYDANGKPIDHDTIKLDNNQILSTDVGL